LKPPGPAFIRVRLGELETVIVLTAARNEADAAVFRRLLDGQEQALKHQ
jgi:hypothetical protein